MIDSILVTGGLGFVGSHVAEYYADQGADVFILDNASRVDQLDDADETRDTAAYNRSYFAEYYPHSINIYRDDVCDELRVRQLVDGRDAVVHTAGQTAVTASLDDPRQDLRDNVLGTLTVLEAAAAADSDPSVVVTSTNKVYGSHVNDVPVSEYDMRYQYASRRYHDGIPESMPIDGGKHTPYGVSKLAADQYVQDYASRGLDAAAFRMSCIYGPRQFGVEDQGWVAHFALSARDGDELTIYGDGKQVRDVLYVSDLVQAIDAYLSTDADTSSVFNIGGGPRHTTSLNELLDHLDARYGWQADVSYADWREGDQKVYISDISRAKDELDWQPEIDIKTGMDRFVDWVDSQ